MRNRNIAMLLAATLLAGTVYAASAGETPPPPPKKGIAGAEDSGRRHHRRWDRDDDEDDWRGPRHRGGWRDNDDHRGPGGRHDRFGGGPGCFGPGCDGPGMGMNMGGFGPGMMGDLELTDAQKTKLMDLMTANFRAGMEAKMQTHDAAGKLRDLRNDDSATPEAIVAANAALGEARGKMEALGRKAREDFRSVLNEDQIKKLDERREKWEERRAERDEMPNGPRPSRPQDGPRGPRGPGGPGPRR